MKKITLWNIVIQIKDEDGNLLEEKVVFNHIDEGWTELDYPLPKHESFSNQIMWKNMKWEKENAYLNEQFVVVHQ